MIQLRPDQADLDQQIDAAHNAGARNVLAVLPTGGGKSIIVSERVLRRHLLGATQSIIAHRTELVGQMSMHIARRGIKHRIIAPKPVVSSIIAEHRHEFQGRSFINPDANCSVAGIDTLNARTDELKAWAAQIDHWYLDEAHHALKTNKWGRIPILFPNATGEGVTATPSRADGMGLGAHHDGIFDTMVIGLDMRSLINIGALADYEIVCPTSDLEMGEEDIAPSGDFSPEKMRKKAKKSHIVGDVVTEYCTYAIGKSAIIFATDVETANEIAERFNTVGIRAASLSAKTPGEVRAEFIRRFRDGRLRVLVNVDLFDEGFDVPACEVVIMARPTASLGKYLQMFGRGLRVYFGKLYGLIIDMVSNWKRHGFPDKSHYWTLDRRDKRAKRESDPEDIPLTSCRSCSRPYERFRPACPYCGAEPPLPAPVSRTLEMVDGDLCLLDRATLEAMRAATILAAPADVANRAEFVAGPMAGAGAANRSIERHAAQQRLKDAIAQWAGVQRFKGREDRESYRRFYHGAGVDVLSALALPRADMESLAARVEGWIS